MKKITIKDIARDLNMSKSTVSRILSNSGYYSPEAKKRVDEYVRKTGFVYNINAKRLRSAKSYTIGLMIPNIHNPFFSNIAYHMDKYLSNKDYTLLIYNTDNDEQREMSVIKKLIENQVDGIICSAINPNVSEEVIEHDIPIVGIDRVFTTNTPITRVISNEYDLGAQLARYVIEKGSVKPLMAMPKYNYSVQEEVSNSLFLPDRFRGFADEFRKNGVSIDRGRLLVYDNEKAIQNIVLDELIDYLAHTEVDSIFAVNDRNAIYVIKTLEKKGIRVPEDIKVIGFDNNDFSQYCSPSLTSVDRHAKEMAITACEKLLDLIDSEHKFIDETIIIEGNIVKRESA